MHVHVEDRQLPLLGLPSREQSLALVGWLALANAFGPVTVEDTLDWSELPTDLTPLVSALMAGVHRGRRKTYAAEQRVIRNRKRRVKARKSKHGLTTGD